MFFLKRYSTTLFMIVLNLFVCVCKSSKASLKSSRGAEGSLEATMAGGKLLEEKPNDQAEVTQNEPTQPNLLVMQ